MFASAWEFNQSLDNWNVESVVSFESMFEGALGLMDHYMDGIWLQL